MPDITIESQITGLKWQGDTPPSLDIEATVPFITSGEVAINPGPSPFFLRVACSLESGYVVIPSVTLPSTEDSSRPDATYRARFHFSGSLGSSDTYKFCTFSEGFRVPVSEDPLTWADIDANMSSPSGTITPSDRTVNDLTVLGDADVGGDVTADGRFIGNGSGLHSLPSGVVTPNSLNSTGSVSLNADTDATGDGEAALAVGGVTKFRAKAGGAENESVVPLRLPDGGLAVSDNTSDFLRVGMAPATLPLEGDLWLSPSLMNVSVSRRAADRTIVLSPTLTWEGAGLAEMNVYKRGSVCHMIYRANDPGRVGWATADFMRGPWTKNPEPILGLDSTSTAVNGISGAWQPSTLVDNGVLYVYWTDNAVGSINVHTGDPDNPVALTSGGVVLAAAGTKKYFNTSVIKDTIAGGYTMVSEVSDSASLHPFALVIASASSPTGTFTVLATLTMFPTASAGASVSSNAMAGGPCLRIENGAYALYFHGGTNGSLPTEIYRAASLARASGWVIDPYPFIRRATALDYDQVADPERFADEHGVGIFWEGVDNVGLSSHIYFAQASRSPVYFDGETWVRAPADGQTTEVRLLAQRIVGVTQPAFIDFENIEQEYDDLLIVIQGRGTAATTAVGCSVRFNANAGADYHGIATSASGSTLAAGESLAQTAARLGALPAASGDAGRAGFIQASVPFYARSDFHKNTIAECTAGHSTGAGTQRLETNNYVWAQTAPITKLTLLPSSGNFATGTIVSIYGMR
jgi:hypothetical protein